MSVAKNMNEFEGKLKEQARTRGALLKTTSSRTKKEYIFVNNEGYIIGEGFWHYSKNDGNYQFFRKEYYKNYYNGPHNNIYTDIRVSI